MTLPVSHFQNSYGPTRWREKREISVAGTQTTPNLGLILPGTTHPDMTNANSAVALLTAALLTFDTSSALYADTGVANAYVITPGTITAPTTGMKLRFKAAHANTAASTLALGAGATKAITKNGTSALAGAEISANQVVEVVYDGTQWQLVSI